MTLIVPALVYVLLIGAASGLLTASQNYTTDASNSDDYSIAFTTNLTGAGLGLLTLGYLIAFLVEAFAQSAFLSGCLDLADGRPVTIGSFFRPRNFGAVFLAALLVGFLTSLASALCFLPGLILGIFTQFTVLFVLDRSDSALKGFTSSFSLAGKNFGSALLLLVVEVAVLLIGALACFLGLVVAVPLAALILTYAFRKLTGGNVAPAQPQGHHPGQPA
ncbi:hypothetical protein A5700_00110 [Mycobacterium sp. E1214]|uniref:hypothetical protein n=1 Tax=Mycobacterium sp. E2462 TaxID=1834133 RepID=UPI000801823F|nr:hypothetical protein [Mycobacterium sp. E2462]OBG75284.1 hypothetical protein A5700_00110 [Mycobacterium sp. E1214]OBH28194.1 hypothetical protein A5693_22615 [Mycobacterium sp. E1319]